MVQTLIRPASRPNVGRLPKKLIAKVDAIRSVRYKFQDNPLFTQRGIEESLFTFEAGEPELPSTNWYAPSLSEEMQRDKAGRLEPMSREQEHLMFLRMNYCKRKLAMLERYYRSRPLTRAGARQFCEWHRRYMHYREYITRKNLGLFYLIAKKLPLHKLDWAEVVSESNNCLLRAVDGFNVERGFKFSTYACQALARELGRMAEKAARHRKHNPVSLDPKLEKSNWETQRRRISELDSAAQVKHIVDLNLADLNHAEQIVIRRRFNWEGTDEEPLTLDEVGQIIGVTRERIRQIQNKAFMKIRIVMEGGTTQAASATKTPLAH